MTEEKKTEKPAPVEKPAPKAKQFAVILIRGRQIGVRHDILKALDSLKLLRKHVCAIIPDNKVNQGILRKVKDFTAYGEVSPEVIKELSAKRKPVSENVFRLAPPRGGFSRKGIKVSYQNGGVLGKRPSMDDLIRRMM